MGVIVVSVGVAGPMEYLDLGTYALNLYAKTIFLVVSTTIRDIGIIQKNILESL